MKLFALHMSNNSLDYIDSKKLEILFTYVIVQSVICRRYEKNKD